MAESEQIVRRKLSDEVFTRLRSMIQTGVFKAGDEMPSEHELMARFGVGRPAVREAMHELANRGLIGISRGERARVLEVTAESIIRQVELPARLLLSASLDSLETLKDTRVFFERGMARVAALKAGPDDIARLWSLIDRQKQHLGEPDAFVDADIAFHEAIAEISGNPIFSAISGAILGYLRSYHSDMLIWTGFENYTLFEHGDIVRALEKADPDLAERAMTDHLVRSRALDAVKNQLTTTDS